MATQLVSRDAVRPAAASVCTMIVESSTQISPGFQRVRLSSTGDGFEADFDYLGFDQWFRLFLPAADGQLHLPLGGGDGWYARWLAQPTAARPVVRNYTIQAASFDGRRWHIDVDVVLHRSPGSATAAEPHAAWPRRCPTVDGVAARWATRARPGDVVGFLDQGRLFTGDDHDGPLLIVADPSGLPAAEGIARSLAGRPASYLLRVDDDGDRRPLVAAHPQWFGSHHLLLERVRALATQPGTHVFAVGEASLVLACRQAARAGGITDEHIDFCAYWRPASRADLGRDHRSTESGT